MEDKEMIINDDSLKVMARMDERCIDSVVTDTPYALLFMGKEWDRVVPSVDVWKEALRVSKPGAHLLAFGGDRTHHRMMVNIEDAGWEIRTCLYWVHGQGFPKSLDVGKKIDQSRGGYKFDDIRSYLRTAVIKSGITQKKITEYLGYSTNGGGIIPHWIATSQASIPSFKDWCKLKEILTIDDRYDTLLKEEERKIIGEGYRVNRKDSAVPIGGGTPEGYYDITSPSTKEAKEWDGYGTGIKPSVEIICMARKPLEGTVAQNVLKWGVGGINIDGCRIPYEQNNKPQAGKRTSTFGTQDTISGGDGSGKFNANDKGRWPSQLCHDGDIDIPNPRFFYCAKPSQKERNMGIEDMEASTMPAAEFRPNHMIKSLNGESGNPFGRFQPKRNNHPTVKPVNLMRWLVRMVTPKGGIVLDPYGGSGTTGIAARLEGCDYILIDTDKHYCDIATNRCREYLLYK